MTRNNQQSFYVLTIFSTISMSVLLEGRACKGQREWRPTIIVPPELLELKYLPWGRHT